MNLNKSVLGYSLFGVSSSRLILAVRANQAILTKRAALLLTPMLILAGLCNTPTAFAAASASAVATLDTTSGPFTSDSDTGSRASASVVDFRTVFVPSGGGNILQGDEGADARAAADTGILRVAASAAQGLQGGLTFSGLNTGASASATARFTIDDLIVSALPGGPPAPAFTPVSLRFAVSGLLPDVTTDGQIYDTATILLAPDSIFASAFTELHMSISLAETGGSTLGSRSSTARLSELTTNAIGAQSQPPVLIGGFTGRLFDLQSGNGFVVETGPITVPVNSALALTVELRGTARSSAFFPQGGGIFESNAQLNFDHTVTFATGGVATLANGFTLNSQQAGIVDNQWTPVPLPSAVWLLMSGLIGLGWRAKRR